MPRRKSLLEFMIVWGCVAFLCALLSCSNDDPTATTVDPADQTDHGQIDPNGDTDFFLGSLSVDALPDGLIEVWGHNLSIESETVVSFDVVLVNRSTDLVFTPLYFYVTSVIPAGVQVANAEWKGFDGSSVFDLSDDIGNDFRLDPDESSRPTKIRFEVPEPTSFAIGFGVTVGQAPVDPGCPYPAFVRALPPDDLEALRAEFVALNPNICSGLDEFGLTTGLCNGRSDLTDVADIDSLVEIAKTTLAKNARFTGVVDAADVVVNSRILFFGRLQIFFANQTYEGLEVVDTHLRVHMDSHGVTSIEGNHYSDICVPAQPIFSPEQAQESIIGLGIVWYEFGGNPRIHVVTEEDLQETPTKAIVPLERYGRIQLLVTWRVPIGFGGSVGWYVYVDTMSKETVRIDQLFDT